MTRSLLFSVCILFGSVWSTSVSASPVTRGQARQQAQEFLTLKGRSLSDHAPYHAPRHTSGQADADNALYYVFNTTGNQGFVVISGDDRTEQVLGYVEHGSFDAQNMPEGLRWLLQMYEEQIVSLDAAIPSAPLIQTNEGGVTPRLYEASSAQSQPFLPLQESQPFLPLQGELEGVACASPARHTVEPLMTTRWNQFGPYNLLCPRYYNDDGTEADLCATGCVATAIAQVIGYYRYPAETQRYIPSYEVEFKAGDNTIKKRLDGIPAHSVIDWDNILDVYTGNETAQQDTAIAQLMYWVGVGCKMGYGPSSGAGFSEGVKALVNYFGFDDGTHIEQRGNFTIEGWSNLLYTELANGHPIAFAGTNSGGAHAFVIDGYDISGLFHLNWGWGGMDDGYFRVDVLAPDDNSGAGASQTPDGYNMGQEAIIGMRLPDDVKAETVQPRLTVNDWELRSGNRFFANYVNWSGVSAQWDMGIAYANEEGGLELIGTKQSYQLSTNTYKGLEFEVKGLAPGTYHMVPVSKRSSQKVWQTHVNPNITYVLVVVDEQGNISMEKRPIEDITLAQLNFPSNHKVGDRQTVQAVFQNHGDEYSREVHLFASPTADKGEHLCRTQVTIAEGGETVSAFTFTPDVAGTWNIWLTNDWDGNDVVGQGTVEITAEGIASSHRLRYASHTVSNRSNGVVYGNCMQGKVTILNQSDEVYDGVVRLWLFKEAAGGGFFGDASVFVHLTIEPNKTAQAFYDFDHLELNANYVMSILYAEGGDIQDGGLKNMGRTTAGILYWQQNKQLSGMAPTKTLRVPSGAVAVDMSCAGNSVQTVQPNENPNTIYILSASAQLPEGLEGKNVVRGKDCERLVLTDNYGFWSPIRFNAAHAEYSRVAAPVWETIALPFAADALPSGVTLKEFTEQDDEGNVCFAVSSGLQRNIPYLIYSAKEGEILFEGTDVRISSSKEAPMMAGTCDFQFTGTTLSTTFNPSEIYDLDAENGCFRLIDERTTVKPFRGWFVCSLGADHLPSAISFDTDVPVIPTAIQPCVEVMPQQVYDMQGRKVGTLTAHPSSLRKGIYVVNGKKVVIH